MGELVGVLVRGFIVLAGNVLTMIDTAEFFGARRRKARQKALARGEQVKIPCVLRDPDLTDGREQQGRLLLGDGRLRWLAPGRPPAAFEPGELTMQAVDEQAITFHAHRTELRLHPDEAPAVLRALGT
ncbi:hypothetical protein VA596_20485 [Amycolatopsis sp., V23-08]|uniref:Uncharacterized protein n=1 Tax=Amycolatopsis heterodermiae TaxID=3110235 RepID=A0ABU5R6T6_9PSEU|nr:hypothetical protein [Amycolatopsis sp., V23-08]MEA5361927.1 hypothetical protein [Amycolatopsis sp., V23-08]